MQDRAIRIGRMTEEGQRASTPPPGILSGRGRYVAIRDTQFMTRLLESLGGFIYVYDLVEQRNVYASPRWGEDFGYSQQETQAGGGALLPRIIHPDDLPGVIAHHKLLRNAADDRPHLLQYRVRRKSGEYAWVSSIDRPMDRDAQGRVRTIAGHAHDITAQKSAELAQAEGRARFRAIVESLPDAVFIAGADTHIMQVNDAACAQLGYTRDELLGMKIPDFVAPEFQARIPERLSQPSGQATARQSAHVRRDGTVVPVETVVVSIEVDGQPAFMGVARDISDRLRLEAQLRDAQRMEAIGRLAGSVAHDFNNIFAAILGGASLLEDEAGLNSEGRALAGEIATAAARGADLTRQLLTFGRRQPTHPQPFELGDAVEHTLGVLRRLLDTSIALDTDLQPGNVVLADRSMVDQVVMNLALNARDAMPGGGTLHIQVTQPADRPDMVEMNVADTGAGIDPADLPKIFEPFFTTKSDTQGSGIGLATVYGIVMQHGGTITAHSAPDEGTRFRVLLPRAREEAAAHSLKEAPGDRPAVPLTILLVEDIDQVGKMLTKLLESRGHRVVRASSAEEARETFGRDAGEIDLLLTDVALGSEEDGPELGAALQAKRPELKVVLMSGFAPDRERIEQVKGAVFLQKPFRLPELEALIAALFMPKA